jgi:predicted SprT family Zn-dependent metalloprotease
LAKVELSTKVIDDQEKLRTTLLHELIHAAVWILEGVSKPPHGKEFKRWAAHAMREIKDVKVTTTHSYEINYRYAWACTNSNCSFIVKRHSKSVDTKKHVCGRCKSSLIEVDPISSNGTSATPKTQPKPSAYNLFVKNQSKIVRQSLMQEQLSKGVKNPNVGQSDVMKECARRWRDHKQKQHTTSSS